MRSTIDLVRCTALGSLLLLGSAVAQDQRSGLAEPDWSARAMELRTVAARDFVGKRVGENVVVALTVGGCRTGTVSSITDRDVSISANGTTTTLRRSGLAPESRLSIFVDDYAAGVAAKQLASEQAAWRAQQASAVNAKIKEAMVREQAASDERAQAKAKRDADDEAALSEAPIAVRSLLQEWKRTGKCPEWPKMAPAVGQIGLLAKVYDIQVAGQEDMLARLAYYFPASVRHDGVRVYDIGQARVWIHGIPTSGLVDDASVELDRVMQITGTKAYATAVGSRKTVFVLEPVDLAPYRKYVAP